MFTTAFLNELQYELQEYCHIDSFNAYAINTLHMLNTLSYNSDNSYDASIL